MNKVLDGIETKRGYLFTFGYTEEEQKQIMDAMEMIYEIAEKHTKKIYKKLGKKVPPYGSETNEYQAVIDEVSDAIRSFLRKQAKVLG